MKVTVEMVRRGASILADPCPTCGGVQVKYHGKVYCSSHEDLSSVLTSEELTYESVVANLRQLLLSKLNDSMGQLGKEKEETKQDLLVSLIAKYVDLLQKLPEK